MLVVNLAMMLVRELWPDDADMPVDLVGCTAEYLLWLDKLPVKGGRDGRR